MKTIYKYPLLLESSIHEVELPMGAEIVHVGVQAPGVLTFWAIVNTDNDNELRRFDIRGTGHQLPDYASKDAHIGTAFDGEFVWHLFEVK